MAKICPVTKEKVLYLECLECNQKGRCKDLTWNANISFIPMKEMNNAEYQNNGGRKDET